MSAQRLNAAEKDLEKFIKFLMMKSTQVVVQSRLGEKIQTQCNPLAGNDWFNIVVQDHPDVYDETKRALALKPGESILQRLPLCVEISLKTVEGDQMILEVWSLDLLQPANGSNELKTLDNTTATTNNGTSDSQTLRAAHAIYNRMGIMLKSLISLTRTTPAYKLSRRQCPDSYGIFYRIYVDRPQVHTLGEGHKHVKIGQLNTIVGSLVMSVAYRTKLTISPTAAEHNNTIMLKSDHFRPAVTLGDAKSSPTQQAAAKKFGLGFGLGLGLGGGGAAGCDKRYIDIEKPLRPGAFTDMGKLRQYTEEDYVLPETPPFEWLLRRQRQESSNGGSIESLNRKCDSPVNGQQQRMDNASSVVSNNNNNNNTNNFNNINNNSMAFKSFEKQPADSMSPIKSLLIAATPAYRHNSAPTLQPAANAQPPPPNDDDNLLKELHFPFASPTSHVNDLAKFYRDCYHAPPLRGLSELQAELTTPTSNSNSNAASSASFATPSSCAAAAASSSADMDDLLEQFETVLEDYEKLASQLGLTGSSSTGSRSSGGLQMSN